MNHILKISLALVALGLSSCASPEHDYAQSVAASCPGYRQYNKCEPWARAFNAKLKSQHIETALVGYTWSQHGETVNHLGVFFKAADGWWYQDNVTAPVQVDSFNQYGWKQRVENALNPSGEPVSYTVGALFMNP
jgi:hypothetical protein